MKVKYEKSIDAAYIYLKDKIGKGEAKNSYPCDPNAVNGAMIVLDFDENYKLLGIEIQDASKYLPQTLLDQAEVIE
jgi:uncharacterized protein YuzE